MGAVPTMTRPATRSSPAQSRAASDARRDWWQSTWALAIAGNVLLWAALPPLSLAPLAWLAPVPWLMLVRRSSLDGRRAYAAIWLVSVLFWLAALYWLTLPHWATAIGWVALAIYLGFYLPAFIGLSRVAVHTLGISSLVAAPTVWVGLDLARAHLLSGFTMASLSHTQYRWPMLLQMSDVFGSYGVSFLIVLVAAAVARMVPWGRRRAWWPLVPAAAALAAALVYGHWRVDEQTTRPGPKVALIQGSIDIDMKYDPTQSQRIFDQYFDLSLEAARKHRDLDLIVWPETMFRYPWYTFDENYVAAPGAISGDEAIGRSRRAIENTVQPLGTPTLLGIDTVYATAPNDIERYNTALFVDREGRVVGRYDKCHPVMFGEYVPLAGMFPWLYRLTPLAGGIEAGAGPRSVKIGRARYAANICYEDTLPHLIRRHVLELREQKAEPDVLVNLTNDGWFWGSSELDMHLASALFRAIECRKPLVIAANTGFSASIDSTGRILAQGPRRATDVIIADVAIDRRASWYLDHGDIPAGVCLAATIGLAAVGLRGWHRQRKSRAAATG
jgi:apolipoprotein N-acyltransferase